MRVNPTYVSEDLAMILSVQKKKRERVTIAGIIYIHAGCFLVGQSVNRSSGWLSGRSASRSVGRPPAAAAAAAISWQQQQSPILTYTLDVFIVVADGSNNHVTVEP